MKKWRAFATDTLFIIIGSLIFAVGLQVFSLPSNLLLGGATGIATILYHFFKIPVGLSVMVVNIPLLIASARKMGKAALWRTLYATVLFSASLDTAGIFLNVEYRGDTLLCALFGGLSMGAGLAVVYARDYVTGGTDLLARLLADSVPALSFSRWIFLIDGAIVVLGAAIFKSAEVGMYSTLMIFIYTLVLEEYFSGKTRAKVALIWTDRPETVRQTIYRTLGRGVTFLEGTGGHSGRRIPLLLCAVSDREAALLRAGLRDTDETSFVIILRATEIFGEGFLKL